MTATTAQLVYSATAPRAVPARRRITPEAGHALEKLGHAIEYLVDEFVVDPLPLAFRPGRLEAVEILMEVNRRVYANCPEVPGLRQRIAAWFRRL